MTETTNTGQNGERPSLDIDAFLKGFKESMAAQDAAEKRENARKAEILQREPIRRAMASFAVREEVPYTDFNAMLERECGALPDVMDIDFILYRFEENTYRRSFILRSEDVNRIMREEIRDAAGVRAALARWDGIAVLGTFERLMAEAVSPGGLRPLNTMAYDEIKAMARVSQLLQGVAPSIPSPERVSVEATRRYCVVENLMFIVNRDFLCREEEQSALTGILRGSGGVITVTGPECSGKTALVAQAARAVCWDEKARPLVAVTTYAAAHTASPFTVAKCVADQLAAQAPDLLERHLEITRSARTAYDADREAMRLDGRIPSERIPDLKAATLAHAQDMMTALGSLYAGLASPVIVIDDLDGDERPVMSEKRSWNACMREAVTALRAGFPDAVVVLIGRDPPADIIADHVIHLDEVPDGLPKP